MMQIRRQAGFTLIELMVVMLIIGLLATMATLSVGGNKERMALEKEARRLLALMQLVQEEAVLTNRVLAMQLDDRGYAFQMLDEENATWSGLDQDYLQENEFPEWMESEIDTSHSDLTKILASATENKQFIPQVLFFPSSQNTPFLIDLSLDNAPQQKIRLTSDGIGEIAISHSGEEG